MPLPFFIAKTAILIALLVLHIVKYRRKYAKPAKPAPIAISDRELRRAQFEAFQSMRRNHLTGCDGCGSNFPAETAASILGNTYCPECAALWNGKNPPPPAIFTLG